MVSRDSESIPGDKAFQCDYCSKSYQQKAHLTRHYATHALQRPYSCTLCSADFQRSDVLARHLRTCVGKRGASQGNLLRKSCDACRKSKKACDALRPCSGCTKKRVQCTYQDQGGAVGLTSGIPIAALETFLADYDNQLWPEDAEALSLPMSSSRPSVLGTEEFHSELLSPSNTAWDDHLSGVELYGAKQTMDGDEARNLRFLERFTRNKGLLSSFDCGTESQRQALYQELCAVKGRQQEIPGHGSLCDRQAQIVTLLKEVISVRPRKSIIHLTWSNDLCHQCSQFFSNRQLQVYLELYWQIWSPNIPFLHRATFDIATVDTRLLAAMAVIGASVSPEVSDRQEARTWFDAVEEAVFQDDIFFGDDQAGSFPAKRRIQILQAAYNVCLFQNWEGGDAGSRRIRKFRYSTLVAIARETGIEHARHPSYTPEMFPNFDWQQYVSREELIRTFLWIFLLDTAFVIFNKAPPRMTIKEMKMHLAMSEPSFQASNRGECYQHLVRGSRTTPITLTSFCQRICKDIISTEEVCEHANLGPLNLFVVTSAIHSTIFQAQQSFRFDVQMAPIRCALSNWIMIWKSHHSEHSREKRRPSNHETMTTRTEMWQRTGFSRYSVEYWMLASLLVERMATTQAKDQDLSGSSDVISVKTEPPEEVDYKYDETSMRQVNDMIAEFQKFGL
ncbi:Transcription factor 1 [Pseudocercospora fuligena]|uniref:Transcription factor 1 n=1 Tax=Pseudocercospora fuligena TaxID=685502 RepID=A0A8H6VKN7_9PEZI|nr:Transcription factor 1 [Pseudocercospora fuligena]